jgi:steroid 5-alpha reductase family enzyme
MSETLLAVLSGAVALFVVMTAVWGVALRIANAGIVDIAWSANFSLLAVLYAVVGSGHAPRRILVTALAVFWSVRLAAYLYRRVMRHHPEEDGRYLELRRKWAPHVNRRLFGFFQLQGLLNLVLSAPFLLASLNRSPGIRPIEWVGVVLWIAALAGETTADRQLDRFRRDPANKGRTCRVGLWRYSRHPNYFFEWLIWVAFFVFALGSPYGWITVYCPLLMLYFLLRVTGIPATEEQALKSRGEAYREYQRTTSVFVPWFPKKSAGGE